MRISVKNILVLAFFALFISGCASHSNTAYNGNYSNYSYKSYTQKEPREASEFSSKFNFSKYHNTRIGGDCSGLITAINKHHDEAIFDSKELNKYFKSGRKSQAMFDLYKDKNKIAFDQPQVGDLVFFNNTTKSTKNSKQKLITHVGIITKVSEDGGVEFLHNSRGKNIISVMNLNSPNLKTSGSKKINEYLIARCKDASCLASNRFSGFGRVK